MGVAVGAEISSLVETSEAVVLESQNLLLARNEWRWWRQGGGGRCRKPWLLDMSGGGRSRTSLLLERSSDGGTGRHITSSLLETSEALAV